MRRLLVVAACAVLVSACATSPSAAPQIGAILSPPAVPVDTLSAAARGLPPCAATSSPGADWREVADSGVRFCVPPDWRPSRRREKLAAHSGAWRGRSGEFFQWGVGPFAKGETAPVPANEVREERATIAGREVLLTELILPQSYTTFARWKMTPTTPTLVITTYTSDPAHRALVRRMIGTVRLDDAAAVAPTLAPALAPALRAGVVVPAVDTMTVTHLVGGRRDTVAFFVQSFRPTTYRAREAWEQIFTWHGRDGATSVDTMYFTRDSLLPLGQLRHNARQDVVATYDGARVHVADRVKGGAESVTDATLAVAPFSSAQFDVIVRALPLAAGYETRLPFYYVGAIGLRSTSARVAGEERIRTGDGAEADCWLVDLEGVGGRQRYWISKESQRFLKLVDYGDPTGEWTFAR